MTDQLSEFARCIRGGGVPETGGREGLEVTAVLQAVEKSVETGKAVEVSEFRDP